MYAYMVYAKLNRYGKAWKNSFSNGKKCLVTALMAYEYTVLRGHAPHASHGMTVV